LSTSRKSEGPVRKGIFEELENQLTSGYGKKEDIRVLDKALRDQYYEGLTSLRHQWEKIYLGVLEAGQTIIARGCKTALQTIDRLAVSVNRADYGYAPLFDRIEKIQGEALNSVMEYDRSLAKSLTQLSQDVSNAEVALNASTWSVLSNLVGALNQHLNEFDDDWSKRKQLMKHEEERR
jgi:hypothetical protein